MIVLNSTQQFNILPCSLSEYEEIKTYIHQFSLDNRCLSPEQFLVAKNKQQIVGFGRIRKHTQCYELCSLGVIEPERNNGIGKELTNELIKISGQPLYLVCIIPNYFSALGFEIVTEYPPEIAEKLSYCADCLCVPESYVVLKYQNGVK